MELGAWKGIVLMLAQYGTGCLEGYSPNASTASMELGAWKGIVLC